MRVLMFGWEFPPNNTGGLGTACYGLTKALCKKNIEILLVLPSLETEISDGNLKLVSYGKILIKKINSLLMPYFNKSSYSEIRDRISRGIYSNNLFEEVQRYCELAERIAREENFDIIHCHDWMTFKAGIKAKHISNKPLVVHVHATEFDRTGCSGVNQEVYNIEREGLNEADIIIAVSNFTKNRIVEYYGIPNKKIFVVHNGVEITNKFYDKQIFNIKKENKIILFLGRITLQKGPDYFIYAAKKVLELEKNVYFVIAGKGDMEPFIIEKAAEFGISDRVLFAGFLSGEDVDKAYQMADLYIMPSVSEPFGITPLEAMRNNTPVIISKQSGVSEIVSNCLKVDFWDIDETVNKIVAVLRYNSLSECLAKDAYIEIRKHSWENAASKCSSLYEQLICQNVNS